MSKVYIVMIETGGAISSKEARAVFDSREDAVVYVNRKFPKYRDKMDDVIIERKVNPMYGVYKKFRQTSWIYKDGIRDDFVVEDGLWLKDREDRGRMSIEEVEDLESPLHVKLEIDSFDRRCMYITVTSTTLEVPTGNEVLEAVKKKVDEFNNK